MPDDWEEIGCQYANSYYELRNSNEFKAIDDPRKRPKEGAVKVYLVPRNETVYSLFETAIRSEKFLDAVRFFMRQENRMMEEEWEVYPPEDKDQRLEASLIKSAFKYYWGSKHAGLPLHLGHVFDRMYMYASEAVWAYVNGEDIEWCYALIDEDLDRSMDKASSWVEKSIIQRVERF